MKNGIRTRSILPFLRACGGLAAIAVIAANTELHLLEQLVVAISGLYFARELTSGLPSPNAQDIQVTRAKTAAPPPTEQRLSSLSTHVPEAMRAQFEANGDASRPRLMPWAVVGFVDIISSTSLSNHLDLESGFELKQRFLHSACERAGESGMIMLNHTGDGFLFLANFGGEEWAVRLVQFHRSLTTDFDLLLDEIRRRTGIRSESGLRFGLSCGPVLLGCLGASATCFTAVGPDVNLASRLCDVAGRNEFVATKRVWDHLKRALPGWPASFRNYDSLRGFDGVINAVHVGSRPVAAVAAELIGAATEPVRSPRRGKLALVKTTGENVSEKNEIRIELGQIEEIENTDSGNETPSLNWPHNEAQDTKVV